MSNHNRFVVRLALSSAFGAAVIALAACGGDDGSDAASTEPSGDSTVSVAETDGRSVLVDANGNPLYVSDEEQASGDILCVSDGCVGLWEPLTIDGDTPTGDVGDAELGVAARPDGANQVTYDGSPLYTFTDDTSGQINGDGLSDTFDGQTLTWRVVTADGSTGGSDEDGSSTY